MSSQKSPLSASDLFSVFSDRGTLRGFAEQARPGWWEADRSDVIDTMACWLTQSLWRHTSAVALLVDREPVSFPEVASGGDERPRLTSILNGSALGCGVPDDVMLRMDAATTRQLAGFLDDVLPARDALHSPRPTHAYYVAEGLFELMVAANRAVQVGRLGFRVADLFDEVGWEGYVDEVRIGVTDVAALVGRYGWEGYLALLPWRTRELGVDAFYGGYRWGQTVTLLRKLAALDDQGWAAGCGVAPSSEQVWEQVELFPWLLDGATARWMVCARVNAWRLAESDR